MLSSKYCCRSQPANIIQLFKNDDNNASKLKFAAAATIIQLFKNENNINAKKKLLLQ
jgi:hypothetical protein